MLGSVWEWRKWSTRALLPHLLRQLWSFSSFPSTKQPLWAPISSALPKLHCNPRPAQLLYNLISYILAASADYFCCFLHKPLKRLLRSETFLLRRASRANTVWNLSQCMHRKARICTGCRGEPFGKNAFRREKGTVPSPPTCQC